MIWVAVGINDKLLYETRAVNKGLAKRPNTFSHEGPHKYETNTGGHIIHNREDGAIRLAIKMLEELLNYKEC